MSLGTVTKQPGVGAVQAGTPSSVEINILSASAPRSLRVTPNPTKLKLSWTAPPSGTVTGYVVDYTSAPKTGVGAVDDRASVTGVNPATAWQAVSRGTETSPPTASQTISGLTNGTAYRVRVRAKFGTDRGDWAFGTGTPVPWTWTFRPQNYFTNSPAETPRLQIELSHPAPAGGLTFALSPKYGTAIPTGLCSGAKATAADVSSSAPTTAKVPAGATSVEFDYPWADNGDDRIGGPSECFAVQASTTATGWTLKTGGAAAAQLTNQNGEGFIVFGAVRPLPGVNAGHYTATVSEGAGTVTVPVTVSHLPATSTQVTVERIAGGTAMKGTDAQNPGDYLWATRTVTFTSGDASRTQYLSFQITDDTVSEDAETIVLRITDAGPSGEDSKYARGFPLTVSDGRQATLTITDNDDPTVPRSVTAAAGDGRVTAGWTAPPGVSVARYEVQHKAKSAGSWPAADTDVAAGTTSHTVTGLTAGTAYQVRVRTVPVGASPGAWSQPAEATPYLTVTLSASPNPVDEGDAVTVRGRLSQAAPSALTIPVTLTRDTSESGDHGTLTALSFASGSTSVGQQIRTNHDSGEDDETFTVSLGTLPAPARAGSASSVQIRIRDDEGIPTVHLSVSPDPVPEGSPFSVEACLRKGGRSHAPKGTLQIPVVLSHGDSEVGDFGHSLSGHTDGRAPFRMTGSVAISGSHQRSCGVYSIPTHADSDGDDETLTVALGALPAGVEAGGATSVDVTIRDSANAEPPRETPVPGTPVASSCTRYGTIGAGLAGRTTMTVGTATRAVSGHVTTFAGYNPDTSAYFLLGAPALTSKRFSHAGTVYGIRSVTYQTSDTDPSGNDLLVLQLDRPHTAALRAALALHVGDRVFHFADAMQLSGTGLRWSNAGLAWSQDQQVELCLTVARVSLSVAPDPAPQGAPLTVTATLSRPASRAVTIPVVNGYGGKTGRDWIETLYADGIPIAAGQTSGSVTLRPPVDEGSSVDSYTVKLDWENLPASVQSGRPGTANFLVREAAFFDGDDIGTRRPGGPEFLDRILVHYDGSPAVDGFYHADAASLAAYGFRARIPKEFVARAPGRGVVRTTRVKLKVHPANPGTTLRVGKVTYDGNGNRNVSLTAVTAGALSHAIALNPGSPLTNVDIEATHDGVTKTYLLAIDPPPAQGSGEDGRYAALIAQMVEWRNDPKWVSYRSHTDRWDRALKAFGETVSDTTLAPMTAAEAQGFADTPWGERWVPVAAALHEIERAARPPAAATPVVTVAAGAAVTEGTSAGFTLTAAPAPAADLAVTVTVSQGGEVADASALGARTVTIAAGSASAAFEVATVDDAADEPDGSVTAALAAGTGYTLGATASAAVAVADDDEPPVAVSIVAGGAVTEGTGAAFTLTAEPAPAAALAVAVTVTQAGDVADASALGARTVTIAAGSASAVFSVATVNDAVDEPDGSVTAALGAGGGYALGSAASATVAVADDDEPPVAVSIVAGGAVTEGEAAAFTLTAEPAPAADLAVAVTVTQGGDVAAASALGARTVTIAAGSASAAFEVATVNDAVDEPDGSVTAALGAGGGYTLGATARATVAVADDDESVPDIVVPLWSTAREGTDAAVAFTVRLSGAAADAVTVDWATADGEGRWRGQAPAAAGADYTHVEGTLVFAAGETTRTVSVPLLDDAIDEGGEYFLVRFSNPHGAALAGSRRESVGLIRNSDPLQRMWLSRFGRTVGGHVTDAVSGRLDSSLAPGAHATLAGQSLDLAKAGDATALAGAVAGLARALGAEESAPAGGGDPFARRGLGRGTWNEPAAAAAPRSVSGRELLLGSSFHLASQGEGSGAALAAWGRVAHGSFDGEAAADAGSVRIDGEVLTGTLGADADFGRMLAGVAISLSEGDGTFDQPGVDAGTVESTMTTVSPYLRLKLTERVSAWGLAGWGTGAMTIVQDARAAAGTGPARPRMVTKTDLSMRLGALGARGALLEPGAGGGMDLALKADALFVAGEWARVSGETDTGAHASRLRLVLEGGRAFALSGTATLRPSLELGLRHDGGDAETGAGLELGGGLAFADAASGLGIEARARVLLAHAEAGYGEWGASATARLDPGARGRGLSFSLSPTLGATSSAAERLWGARDAHGLAPGGAFEASRGLTAEAGFGLPVFGGGFTATPNVGLGLADGGLRDWRLGWRLASAVEGDPGFEVSLDAVRREPANDAAPEHGVMLRGAIRW